MSRINRILILVIETNKNKLERLKAMTNSTTTHDINDFLFVTDERYCGCNPFAVYTENDIVEYCEQNDYEYNSNIALTAGQAIESGYTENELNNMVSEHIDIHGEIVTEA